MSSNIAKVIHEPPKKRHCRERLNAEIDDKCLILLGMFHSIITLGTMEVRMPCTHLWRFLIATEPLLPLTTMSSLGWFSALIGCSNQ